MDGFFVCKLRKFSNKIGPSQPVAVKTSANGAAPVATGSNAPSGASQRAKEARKEKPPKPYFAPRSPKQPEAEAAPAESSKKRRRDNGK